MVPSFKATFLLYSNLFILAPEFFPLENDFFFRSIFMKFSLALPVVTFTGSLR